MLVPGSGLPFDSLQTPKLSAAALHCVLLGVQTCRCQPSTPDAPHSGSTHCPLETLRVPFAALQTAQPLTAALHKVLFKRLNTPRKGYTLPCSGFKTAICHPSNPLTLRSGPTDCVVAASRLPVANLPTGKPSAPTLHTLLLRRSAVCRPSNTSTVRSDTTRSVGRGSRVPWASLKPEPFFQTLTLSQRPYRLSCRSFQGAVCRPSIGSTLRSGPTQHSLVQTAQPSAAALHTVLLKAQDFQPLNALQPPYTLSS